MPEPKRYRRKENTPVTAVQLKLDFAGFTYEKWGDTQRCNRNDWLLENNGEVYTVREDVFEQTYQPVKGSPGRFEKTGHVWAKVAEEDGSVGTFEGRTHYKAGDYIVATDPDWKDVYAMSPEDFEARYVEDPRQGFEKKQGE